MLTRVKFKDKDEEDGCLCQKDKKCDLNDWAQCEGKHCSSQYWHKECVGLASLTDDEFEKVNFICPLCLLSQKKFKKSFILADDNQEKLKEIKSITEDLKEHIKLVKETKDESFSDIVADLKKHIKDVQTMKEKQEQLYQKEEKERVEFYKKVSKQLIEFKKELKDDLEAEAKQERDYKEALLKNVTRIETNQQEVASKVAKEVVVETRMSTYDRSMRENNVMLFGKKESGEDGKKDDEEFVDDLFSYLGMQKNKLIFQRIGSKKADKDRPIKMIFESLDEKKKFLLLLYKLEEAPKNLKEVRIQHDLSPAERDRLSSLLDKAKELNKIEKPKNFQYKVRGPPSALEIRKVPSRQKN